MGSLANSIYAAGNEGGAPSAAMQQLILLGSTLASIGIGNQNQTDPTVPRAYLKYLKYDVDSQFVSQGFIPITGEANESYERLFLQLVAEEDGFVQFFVANETLRDVYFDDITGMVRRPKIIQEAHYNPFGLPLAGLTTLGNPEYAYFFTGKELYEDEALQWYDYGARMYDVQIGRWTTHDPLYQDASPYVFCGNNPIMRIDPTGMNWFEDAWDWTKDNWKEIAITGACIGVGILTGGTGGLVLAGTLMGGYSGYQTGKALGLSGGDLLTSTLLGAGIGALSSYAGSGISSYIGKTSASRFAGLIGRTVGSAVSGATQRTGFGLMVTGFNNEADIDVFDGLWKGTLSGAVGGAVGARVAGGGGALLGGALSNSLNAKLDGKNWKQAIGAGIYGGAMSWGAYQMSQAVNYKKFNNQDIKVSRKQFNGMSRAAQISFATGKETGGYLLKNGSISWWGRGDDDQVIPTEKYGNEIGSFHTHPNPLQTSIQYHSPEDIQFNSNFDLSSIVIGRQNYFSNNFCTSDICNLGTNAPFNPYYSFNWFFK